MGERTGFRGRLVSQVSSRPTTGHADHVERITIARQDALFKGTWAPQRIGDLMGEEADALLGHRYEFINVWRPIRGPLCDAPLAMCDARSVSAGDLIPSDLVYRNRKGEIDLMQHNPKQRWSYVPAMHADEVLLLKCYDSVRDGRAVLSPHGTFVHPTAPADVLPRESIELRTIAFHAA